MQRYNNLALKLLLQYWKIKYQILDWDDLDK